MPCGWEGNRRSGVALAMRHRLKWFIQLRAHGLRKGDEHPAYTPHGIRHSFLGMGDHQSAVVYSGGEWVAVRRQVPGGDNVPRDDRPPSHSHFHSVSVEATSLSDVTGSDTRLHCSRSERTSSRLDAGPSHTEVDKAQSSDAFISLLTEHAA